MDAVTTDPLKGRRRILLYGGSFDPPHRAHVILPQQVAQKIGADLIAYIPAGRAPHKLDRKQTDPEHRLMMLRLTLQAQPGTVVLTDEIERTPGEPSYTVDTLEAIRRRVDPATELRLLIGADQVRIFDQWRRPDRVIELAEPVVMVRPPDTRASLLNALPPDRRTDWASRLVDVDAIELSSTALRDRVARAQPIAADVGEAVAEYIREHGLYAKDEFF